SSVGETAALRRVPEARVRQTRSSAPHRDHAIGGRRGGPANPRNEVAGAEGFEPSALGFGDRCSDQTELRPFGRREILPSTIRGWPRTLRTSASTPATPPPPRFLTTARSR